MVGKEYDEFDLRDARNIGFLIGTVSGASGMFILCVLVGLYFSS